MNTITLDRAIDTVMQLPREQQEMLLEIVHRRHIEERRQEMAADAHASLATFRAGKFVPLTAAEVIAELRATLDDDEE